MSSIRNNLQQCVFCGFIFIFCVLIASQATARSLRSSSYTTADQSHEQWMSRYGRVYKDDAEKDLRSMVFYRNVEFIQTFNKGANRPFKLAVNEFADLTNEEFVASRNGLKSSASRPRSSSTVSKDGSSFRYENVSDIPISMDWRENGAVTAVKNQGPCGSCWAFSAIAAVEGINQISTRWSISLSEQELVDCDRSNESQGCMGGYMEDAFEFIKQKGGIASTDSYPYKAIDETCDTTKASHIAAKISGYEEVPANSEDALLKAVANQPVAVAIDAGGEQFQFYSTGVFTGECGTELNHGVTAVGYGESEEGIKYWLVKNSWGVDWGDQGYIMMQRGIDAKEGLCGIAMDSSYPTA